MLVIKFLFVHEKLDTNKKGNFTELFCINCSEIFYINGTDEGVGVKSTKLPLKQKKKLEL